MFALRKLGIPTLPRKAGIAPPHRRLSAISSATRRVRWLPSLAANPPAYW